MRLMGLGLMGLLGLGLLGLVGCSDDSGTGAHYVSVEAQSCTTPFVELGEGGESRALSAMGTRTWTPPTGYITYTSIFEAQKDLTHKSILAFFTKGTSQQEGTFFYKEVGSSPGWRLNKEDLASDTYQIYGYIPKEDADNASIAPLDGNYSNGAVLTINGLSTVTTSDVCFIIGAKDGRAADDDTGESDGIRVAPGKFDVQFKDGQNFMFLLFDHLYSALRFQFKVDANYNKLRTIVVKKLEVIAYADANETGVRAKQNATITLRTNGSGASPLVGDIEYVADNNSSYTAYKTIYEGQTILSTEKPAQFMGGFASGVTTFFKLRTTYDVYDKNQVRESNGDLKFDSNGNPVYNLIRQNCEAENMINLLSSKHFNLQGSNHGQCFSYTITVQPTYLYMLSEPDLDNPTVRIEN